MMRKPIVGRMILLLVLAPLVAAAQDAKPAKKKAAAEGDTTKKARAESPFFRSETPVEASLTVNLKQLRGDKGDAAPWRNATMSIPGATDTAHVTVPLRVKTRGIWRLKTCDFPPLRLNFAGAAVKCTVFCGLDKPKLVSYCRNTDDYEQYVLQEQQLYRAYHLLTPASHESRLLHLTYIDSASGKPFATRYAFLLDEVEDIGARIGAKPTTAKGARPDDLDPHYSALFGMIEYFVGNTDFAISALHNVELFTKGDGSGAVPVAHDFDFSGAVNARYATVDPSVRIRTVRDRIFRGYCTDPKEFAPVFALFNEKKAAIYALYGDDVGKLLQPAVAKRTLEYFDEFYRTINKPSDAKDLILDACIGKH